jgi:hypothetical protein
MHTKITVENEGVTSGAAVATVDAVASTGVKTVGEAVIEGSGAANADQVGAGVGELTCVEARTRILGAAPLHSVK